MIRQSNLEYYVKIEQNLILNSTYKTNPLKHIFIFLQFKSPLQFIIKTTIMSQNPYQKIYDDLNITITPQTTLAQAEILAKHLGYIYNTFGIMVKDFISLLGQRFRTEHAFKNDRNKKDRKLTNFQSRSDKKARSHDQMQPQQLEGKFNGAPNRLINQIQNYNQPGNLSSIQQQHPHHSKNHHLTIPKNQPSHHEASTLEKDNSKNQLPDPQPHPKTPQTQINNSSENPETVPPRKIIPRRKRDHEVINISSEDEQKQEDSLSGVRTRAQHRGEQKPMMRPDSLLRGGRGRGRGRRGRPSSRGSSRLEENNEDEKKSLSSYPSHPSDPFTIIHNVPYKGSSKSSNVNISPESTPSKKEQLQDKKFQKQMSESNESQKEYEGENQSSRNAIHHNKNQSIDQNQDRKQARRSQFNKDSFIKKVMSSYLQEKKQIKEKLDNLDKEYVRQKLNLKPHLNPSDSARGKQSFGISSKYAHKEVEEEEDGYEYQVQEQQVSFQKVPQSGHLQQQQQQQVMCQQVHDQQQYQQQVLLFQKLNPSPKPSPRQRMHQNQQESYNYLQQINQSIQQEFEENLRMNHQIYDQASYQQQQEQQEDISYESLGNYLIEESQEDQMPGQQHEEQMPGQQHEEQMPGQQHEEQMPPQQHEEQMPGQQHEEQIPPQQHEEQIPPQQQEVLENSNQSNYRRTVMNPEQERIQEQNSGEKVLGRASNNNTTTHNNHIFDSLFHYQTHPTHQTHNPPSHCHNQPQQHSNPHFQTKPNSQLSHPTNLNQLTIEQQHIHHSQPTLQSQAQTPPQNHSQLSQTQKLIAPTQSYFPFIQEIHAPDNSQAQNYKEIPTSTDKYLQNPQDKSPKQPNSTDKEQLLKVLDAFESDEDQPKKGLGKTPVPQNIRQVLIEKLALMKKTQLKHLAQNTTIKEATKLSIEKSLLSDNPLHLQNSSIHQNKPLSGLISGDNNKPLVEQERANPANKESPEINGVNGGSKGVQQSVPSDSKKPSPAEFVSILKKNKYIEVIELQ